MNIKHDTSKGFALGVISHGIGTARAIEISEKAAAFSALAITVATVAVVTATCPIDDAFISCAPSRATSAHFYKYDHHGFYCCCN